MDRNHFIPQETDDNGFLIQSGSIDIDWLQDITEGKVVWIIEPVFPTNGYGFLQYIFLRLHQNWKLSNVLEIGPQVGGFILWKSIIDSFPWAYYAWCDSHSIGGLSFIHWNMQHIADVWPYLLGVQDSSINLFYHHRIWPQLGRNREEQYFSCTNRVMSPGGIYISMTRHGSSNPPPLSAQCLVDNWYRWNVLSILNQCTLSEDRWYDVLFFQKPTE